MKRLKRYAVYGLTEWVALIRAGNATVRVCFSGGSLSALGTVPATFATADAVLQRLIEDSAPFRNGKITLLP